MYTNMHRKNHRIDREIEVSPVHLLLGSGLGMAMRLGEYAFLVSYAHMCEYADKNLIHIYPQREKSVYFKR